MFDTIVIGSGPVGSFLARRLVRLGHSVTIMERSETAGHDVCCTGVVGQACADLLEVDPSLVLREIKQADFVSPGSRCLRLAREAPVAFVLDRSGLERVLADQASRAGVQYLFSAHATGVAIENDRAVITAVRRGRTRHFEARSVVIASGFGSALSRQMGLGGIRDVCIGAQVRVSVPADTEVTLFMDQARAPHGFGWLVPTRDRQAMAGVLTRSHHNQNIGSFLARLNRERRIHSVKSTVRFGAIPLEPLSRTFDDRVLVVGEAAGQVKPTTGGGIYYGLLCAEIAVDTLQVALESDRLDAKSLAGYEERWRSLLSRELAIGRWARALWTGIRPEQVDFLFELARRNGVPDLILESEQFSFDWHGGLLKEVLQRISTRPIRSSVLSSLNASGLRALEADVT